MTTLTFSELGVAEPLRRVLIAENYTTPTPIQTQAIPLLLAGRDILGIAQTGTGKTAAFALPILQRLADAKAPVAPQSAQALILAPTRELALQIDDSLATYGRHLGLRHTVIMGGVKANAQIRAMARGVHILVATPGRLLDLVNQRHIRLDKAATLVLDEADRMLDMGFVRDVRRIVALLPKVRQSLLFSATMPGDVAKLAGEILNNPQRVEVSPRTMTADRVEQSVFFVDTAAKRDLLGHLLKAPEMSRVIVFTRTKHGANKVAKQLGLTGVDAEAIHGNKSQAARQRALERFRSGDARVLVATDIAARGLDVDDVSHVINYELPNEPESYVHRIGRTARAGAGGVALSFCDPSERAYLRDIEKLTKTPIKVAAGQPVRATVAPSTRPAASNASRAAATAPLTRRRRFDDGRAHRAA
jgi:ATP-dependent RNA helicase RhlE